MDKKNFSLPKKSKCGNFIAFYFINPNTRSNKRFRKYIPNATPKEKKAEALDLLLQEWTIKLRAGFNPFLDVEAKQKAAEPFFINTIIKEICDERTQHLRSKTASTYLSKVTIFREWLQKNNLNNTYIADFSRDNAEAFLRWLSDTKGRNASPTTRNAYMLTLRTLWNSLRDKRVVNDNPWKEITKVKESRLGKLPLKAGMKKTLLNAFSLSDPELWLFVQFEYYCFIRPGEIIQLKVGAIDLDDEKILIDADISKNHKSEYVVIPPPFLAVLRQLKITSHKHSHFIFSPGGVPGAAPYSKDVFNRRHKAFTDRFGFNRRYSLYSWKHSGACDAAMAGANIKQLQMQLRHADLQTTDIYLRSLGIADMGDLKQKFPSL